MHIHYLEKLEYFEILHVLSNYAITELGKQQCEKLLPMCSKEKISVLLAETSEGVHLLRLKNTPPFIPISDLKHTLKQIELQTTLSSKNLLEIAQILRLSFSLKNYYIENNNELSDSFPILDSYFSNLYTNIELEKCITNSILDENTIADTASVKLASIRKQQRQLEETIKHKLNFLIHSSYTKYLQEPLITLRNNRYVLPVKLEYQNQIKGFIHDTSSSGSTVFMEPVAIFDFNNQMNLLKLEEAHEIEIILATLSALVYPIFINLQQNISLIGTLDFIFAKAKYAIAIDGIEPIINPTKQLHLEMARHPLIPKETVVPIDIELGNTFSTLIITGPNTGGKTVTLKTVGLLILMACSGLHIPAKEHSSIYVFDQVFADIGDEQSIQESLSTFSSHMSHIVEILKHSTSESLVLLDELGSGTDPIEGSSLAISILEEFHQKSCLTLSTTHYPEVKNYVLITEGFENASVEFDVEKLEPTYRLLIGVPGKSNAFSISKKLGLSPNIIQRATHFIPKDSISTEELLKQIYDDKVQIEKEKEEIEKNLHQIESLRISLEEQKRSLDYKQSDMIQKAKQQARAILLEAKEDASTIIKEMKLVEESGSIKELNHLRNQLTEKIKKTSSTVDTSSPFSDSNLSIKEITMNMPVFITTLNQEGSIISLPNKAGQVQVQVGNAKMSISITHLIKLKKNSSIPSIKTSAFSNTKSKSIHTEINVIGNTVDEAIFVIDKFLDDAILSKLHTIRIVHGKGTGALRKGIHQFLKSHPHVKSYRLGTYGEGEIGVTIVELI